MKFTVVKKGYSPSEVDEYIAAVKREYESTIIKQRDRIQQMLDEKQQTEKELKTYRDKSSQISKAIVGAVAKAEEIERLSRIKYNQEISRLKAFHEKWTNYYNRILEEYPLDERLAAAGEFNRRMDKILERINPMAASAVADTAAEVETVEIEPQVKRPTPPASEDFDPMKRIDGYFASGETTKKPPKREYTDRSPSGFSFEEALNPTDDLETILKDLGFSDD